MSVPDRQPAGWTTPTHILSPHASLIPRTRRRTRSRVVGALIGAALVVGIGVPNAAATVTPAPGSLSNDVIVPKGPPGPSAKALDAQPQLGGPGYTILNRGPGYMLRDRESYTIKLTATGYGDVESLRDVVEWAAAQASRVGGVHIDVAAGTVPNATPDQAPKDGEIVLSIDSTVCREGSAGCAEPQQLWPNPWAQLTEVGGGRIWIEPIALGYSLDGKRAVVAHELGHALGLDHHNELYNGRVQVMNATADNYQHHGVYQDGDINGLRALAPPPSSSIVQDAPQIQLVDGTPSILVRGQHNSLIQYAKGAGGWGSSPLAGWGTTFSSPSVTVFGTTPMTVVRGPNDELMQYWKDASGWHAYAITGAGKVLSNPTLQVFNGQAMVFVQGADHTLMQYVASSSGWTPYQIAGAETTYSNPQVQVVNGRATVLVRGPSKSLVQYAHYTSGWGRSLIADEGTTFSSPSLTVFGTTPMTVVRGGNDELVQYWKDASGWSSYAITGPGKVFSNPAIQVVNGKAMAFVQGADHSLMQYVATETSGWAAYQVAGAGTTYSNPQVQVIWGTPMLAVRGPNGDLVQYTNTGAGGWSPFTVASNAFN